MVRACKEQRHEEVLHSSHSVNLAAISGKGQVPCLTLARRRLHIFIYPFVTVKRSLQERNFPSATFSCKANGDRTMSTPVASGCPSASRIASRLCAQVLGCCGASVPEPALRMLLPTQTHHSTVDIGTIHGLDNISLVQTTRPGIIRQCNGAREMAGCPAGEGWMHAHCGCSMSAFRRSTFSDRIARSSLLAFIALWNSALPHRRQHQLKTLGALSVCPCWASFMPVVELGRKVRAH